MENFSFLMGPEVAFRYHCDCRSILNLVCHFVTGNLLSVRWRRRRDLASMSLKLPPWYFLAHNILCLLCKLFLSVRVALEYRKLNLCTIYTMRWHLVLLVYSRKLFHPTGLVKYQRFAVRERDPQTDECIRRATQHTYRLQNLKFNFANQLITLILKVC